MKLVQRAAGYLSGFTWKFWLIGMGALAVLAGAQTLRLAWAHERIAQMEANDARAAAQAVENARKADATGVGKAEAGKGAVEAGNAKAREAARGSADPLRDGLEALR